MPQSKKRKIEKKTEENQVHYNVGDGKAGKTLIVVLCIAMVLGLLIGAVALMIQYLQ